MPPKNNQPDLFTRIPDRVAEAPRRYELPGDYGEGLEPRGLDTIPAWLRLPGEPGYVEMDRFMRPVDRD